MKLLLTTILICSIALVAFAEVDLEANGYDWLAYSTQEKFVLLALIYRKLDLDKKEYKVKKGVETVDRFYNHIIEGKIGEDIDVPRVLEMPCIDVLSTMIVFENKVLNKQ